MPGTQAQGTHSFDPASLSSVSATQALDTVNAEDDGEEDQAGPPVGTPLENMPAAFSSAITSILPPAPDMVSLVDASSSQGNAIPPPDVFLYFSNNPPWSCSQRSETLDNLLLTPPPEILRLPAVCENVSTTPLQTWYHPAPSDCQRNKMHTLNPVIIFSQLNSTVVCLADIMEKLLDITATSIDSSTTLPAPSPPSHALSAPPPSTSAMTSNSEILDKAFEIVTADRDFLSEDDLLAASLLFSNTKTILSALHETLLPSASHQQSNIVILFINSQRQVFVPEEGREKLLQMMTTILRCWISPVISDCRFFLVVHWCQCSVHLYPMLE